MHNQFTEFKMLLKMLSLKEQLTEINEKIIHVRNEKCIPYINNHAFDVIKELKHMRQNVLNSINNTNIILQQ